MSLENDALYVGDCGELDLETRRTYVQLLSGPMLDASRHSKLWPVLLNNEQVLRRRLADLFLELVIDKTYQVAYARQADTGELDTPKLLRHKKLTFLPSVLLLYLRQLLIDAEAHDERAVVSEEEIIEQLTLYRKAQSTDHAGFLKRASAAIERVKDQGILNKLANSQNRYEISPILKLLFSIEEVKVLQAQYKAHLQEMEQVDE